MTDRLLALRVFVRTARSGSFSAAGRELGLSQPSVSRILAQLEEEVGAALLVRTTRAVTLTETGADYLARIELILAGLEEADHAARGGGQLRGTVKVAVSVSFGVREIVPILPEFLERHPGLKLDIAMSDGRQDLVAEGFDLALRIGSTPSPSTVIRKLAEAPRLLIASPAYLERHGRPRTPGDLASHALIIGPGAPGARTWAFSRAGGFTSIQAEGRLVVTANEGVIAAARAGLGVATTSMWGCRAELERGEVVRVLEDWPMAPAELLAILPSGRAAAPAARAFIEHLSGRLSADRTIRANRPAAERDGA